MVSQVSNVDSGSFVGLAVSADFSPEYTARGFVELTLAVPKTVSICVGLFEVRFLRALTEDEQSHDHAQYEAIVRAVAEQKGAE